MPGLGDKYGRWTLFLATYLIQVPVYLCLVFAKSLSLVYLACFYAGISFTGRFANGYLLLTELVPEKHESWVGPGLISMDSSIILFLTFYYRYVSKDTMPLIYIGLALNLISGIVTLVWVPESVRWLVSVREFGRAREALARMATFNGAVVEREIVFK